MDLEAARIKEICLQLLDSVLNPHSAAYVSGPLDSGRLFYESLAKYSNPVADIRQRNQERLTEFAQKLRCRLPYPVIDPGPLRVHKWKGADYGIFFLEVLERYANEAWFIDGWEFSTGATKEFILCISKGIPCFTESGEGLTPHAGKLLVADAVSFIDALGLDSSKLRSRSQSLNDIIAAIERPRNSHENHSR